MYCDREIYKCIFKVLNLAKFYQELAYGGWVAPNIYYLGYAGVVSVNGVRIAGLSGIYKVRKHFHKWFIYIQTLLLYILHIITCLFYIIYQNIESIKWIRIRDKHNFTEMYSVIKLGIKL